MRIVTYINSLMELDLYDIELFAKEANKPNRNITRLLPKDLAGYDGLEQGVVVIWEGDDEEYHINEVRDAFREEWEKDCTGEGPGRG